MLVRTMENNEEVLQALHEFEATTDADKVLTQDLEDMLSSIAKTGRVLFPWNSLKPVFLFKLDKVMREFFESSPSRNSATSQPTLAADFEIMRHRLLDCLDSFTSAPFTIQRLCELMVEPRKHYNNSDKFMRGVEKNVLVVSTLELGSDEIAVFGLTNNIDGAHILSTLPNGPVTNGVMTSAVPSGGNSVTEDGFDERHVSHVTPEGVTSHLAPDTTRPTPLNAQENGCDKQEHFVSDRSLASSSSSEDKSLAGEGEEGLPEREQGGQGAESLVTEEAAPIQREEAPERGAAEGGEVEERVEMKVAPEAPSEEKDEADTSRRESQEPMPDSDQESAHTAEETGESTEVQESSPTGEEEPMDEN